MQHGPVLAVLILGIFYQPDSAAYKMVPVARIDTTADAAQKFLLAFPDYLREVAAAILPIAGMLLLFQLLTRQVKEVSNGSITAGSMKTGLSVGVAVSVGISILRILTGIPILYFLVPGHLISLLLTFFVPKICTGIAFDSGGVASGPMTSTFLLPLAMGACTAVGGNVVADAFGIVALVALAPLIAIQCMGVVSARKAKVVKQPIQAIEDLIVDLE